MEKQNKRLGLTLIEMIVVLSIMTLMAGLVVPLIDNFRAYEGVREQKKQFAVLDQAVTAWARDEIARSPQGGDVFLSTNSFPVFSNSYLPDQSLVDYAVLSGTGAGRSYLTHWFEDQRLPASFPSGSNPQQYQLADAWGNALVFDQWGNITSNGPSGNTGMSTVGAPGGTITLNFNPNSLWLEDRRQRSEVINSAIEIMMRDQSTQGEPLDRGNVLNSDPRWQVPNVTDVPVVQLNLGSPIGFLPLPPRHFHMGVVPAPAPAVQGD